MYISCDFVLNFENFAILWVRALILQLEYFTYLAVLGVHIWVLHFEALSCPSHLKSLPYAHQDGGYSCI